MIPGRCVVYLAPSQASYIYIILLFRVGRKAESALGLRPGWYWCYLLVTGGGVNELPLLQLCKNTIF